MHCESGKFVPDLSGWGRVNKDQLDYFRRRELDERAAERNATCEAAKRVHHELAEEYAERLRQPNPRS
jgi:hypothetical protein